IDKGKVLIGKHLTDRPRAFEIGHRDHLHPTKPTPDPEPEVFSCCPMHLAVQQAPSLDQHVIRKDRKRIVRQNFLGTAIMLVAGICRAKPNGCIDEEAQRRPARVRLPRRGFLLVSRAYSSCAASSSILCLSRAMSVGSAEAPRSNNSDISGLGCG